MTDETLPAPEMLAPAGETLPVTTSIRGASLAWITFGNTLLSILTLGIWSFWAKTRVRRYLWANIQIAGDPLHYTGTGFELFKGAIIALLVLALAFVPLSFLSAAGYGGAAGPIQISTFLILTPMGMFYARRYRLSRTEWRGIRAGFSGNVNDFIMRAMGVTVLSLFTAFLFDPLRQAYVDRYFWNHSYFGTHKFRSTFKVGDFVYLYVIAWGLAALGIAKGLYEFGPAILLGFTNAAAGESGFQMKGISLLSVFLSFGWVFPIALLFYALYRIAYWRALVTATHFDTVSAKSRLTAWNFIKIIAVLIPCFIVFFAGIIALVIALFASSKIQGGLEWWVFGFLLLLVLAANLFISGLWAWLWTAPLVRVLVRTTEIEGTLDLAIIDQSTLPSPGRGEGLLGAVDFTG
ncbi:DUF898 family protein [Elstera sp.]|jgi:uncharacterized membrane protein YjgN (DUF898 family)|uniref:DUF898 family protein n=1 Tax=Elstera sp. TaxID=1916664 RepID=UPI0037C17627